MSKKKKAAPKKEPAKVVKMPTKAKAAKKATPRERINSPKSVPLPGMEQVTNRALNRICEHISDVRREMNRARGEEKDLMNQAVTVMTDSKQSVYRFSGVELLLVPGDVHLRVRTLKEGANTNAPSKDAPADDAGVTADETEEADEPMPAIHEEE